MYLVVPDPIGLGTEQAESLLSVAQRTAAIYRVSVSRVLRLALAAHGSKLTNERSYNTLDAWLGYKAMVAKVVGGLEALSGNTNLSFAALYKLGQVVGHGRGLLAKQLRICPKCVHPEAGLGYGPVCHQLLSVTRCPIHAIPLNEWCLSCGRPFGMMQECTPGSRCLGCSAELFRQVRETSMRDSYDSWCEQQSLRLVEFATNPFATSISIDWADQYVRGLGAILGAEPGIYAPAEHKFCECRRKSAVRRAGSLPSYSTLLRLSAMQAVGAVDLVVNPKEALSPRLLAVSERRGISASRRSTGREQWNRAKVEVLSLLRDSRMSVLPPKSCVLGALGLRVSGFWQRYPDLSVSYEDERMSRLKSYRSRVSELAEQSAWRIVCEAVRRGGDVQVRRDGEIVRAASGAPKAVAESAVRNAIEQYKWRDRSR